MTKSAQPPRRRPNYFYSILSVAAVLFLLGFFGMLLLQSQRLTKVLKEQVNIIVELTTNVSDPERQTLEESLVARSYLKSGTVVFTSKEDALALMSEELGEDLLELNLPNPLYDAYTFNVKSSYLTTDSLASIREQLLTFPAVQDVYYQESLVGQLERNMRRLGIILPVVALLFILLAFTAIHNTIRLDLYANRFLIKTQELVGATWEFIAQPYLRKALWHGLLSGLLAVGLLVGLQFWLQQQIPEARILLHAPTLGILFLAMLVLGMLINWLSTYQVVRKYLRLREDELYQE